MRSVIGIGAVGLLIVVGIDAAIRGCTDPLSPWRSVGYAAIALVTIGGCVLVNILARAARRKGSR